jgi:hypothetical protein
LSGDAIDRINASSLDKVVVTNSVDQADHLRRCPKLEVLEIGHVFAEVSTRRTSSFDKRPDSHVLGHPSRPPRRKYQCSFPV